MIHHNVQMSTTRSANRDQHTKKDPYTHIDVSKKDRHTNINRQTHPNQHKGLSLPRAILCDMDGVLVDSEHLHWHSVLLTLQKVLNQSTLPQLPLRIGWNDTQLWQELVHHYQLPVSVEACIQHRKAIAHTLLHEQAVPLMQGVYETLSYIKARYPYIPLAVVSASLKDHMHISLKNIDQFFTLILSGFDDCSHNKPHPMPYLRASEILGVPIESCWILEDSTPGLQAALGSQAQVFAVHAQQSDLTLRQRCVAQLDQFKELIDYLAIADKGRH